MHILGLSAYYHDSAACIIRDGEILAAAQEERFSRCKGDERFPTAAANYCLSEAGISANQLDAVAYYDKPIQTFGRLMQSFLEFPWRSYGLFRQSLPVWINKKTKIPKLIDANLPGFAGEIYFSRHHESHAASAFFCSPFEEAAIVVVDGVGEWASTSIGKGRQSTIQLLLENRFPHSIGLFYSAMTQFLGFKVNRDEYKVMGLAPYGEPRYADLIREHLVDLKSDGSIGLNLKYFAFPYGLRMIRDRRLQTLTGHGTRTPESELEQFHMDWAASVQAVTTDCMIKLARTARDLTGLQNLCLVGGVALNCVGNGSIYREGIFENIYIQPAAGDAGGSLGAALQVWHQVLGHPRDASRSDRMAGAFLGPRVEGESAARYLVDQAAEYTQVPEHDLAARVARWIAAGNVVGVCRGRMEFGPRALGSRSILGDPRDPESQSRINRKVKYRESFRPFAPAILEERVGDYFEIDIPSPYMLIVMPLRKERRKGEKENAARSGIDKLRVGRSDVPAVTHVDYSVRLQTLTRERNGFFYEIVSEFDKLTGCPMVVNTSFNVRGEPIVCDEEDAYRCFRMTDIDILVLGNCVVTKAGVDLSAEPRRTHALSVSSE